jgi:hypothetical protein
MGDRFFLWFGSAFAAFGLLFAGIGARSFFDDMNFQKTAINTSGTVIGLDRRSPDDGYVYAPVVEWRDPSGTRHQFVGGVASSPPSYDIGETVGVAYQPGRPGQARVDSFTERGIMPLAFGGMGSIFAAIGLTLVILHLRRRYIIGNLKRSGLPLRAKVMECYRDTSTKVNGRSPWRVAAQATHPLTGKIHRFESDHVWVDLSEVLDGKTVQVLYDPEDADDYLVDLSDYVRED